MTLEQRCDILNSTKEIWKLKTKKGEIDMAKINRSKEELEEIIKDINNALNFEKELGKYRNYKILTVYFLWKMQTDSSIKTPEDMQSRGFYRETVQFATMTMDDLIFYFSDAEGEWKNLRKLIGKYTDEELEECILNTDYYDEEFFESIPESVSNLVDKMLDIKKDSSVLEINGSEGAFSIYSKSRHENSNYTLYDEDSSPLAHASVIADVKGYRDICITCDPSDEPMSRYDRVFVNNIVDPSKSTRTFYIEEYLDDEWVSFPRKETSAWSSCAGAIVAEKKDGKIVAIMNAGDLTVKQSEKAREFMIDAGFVEGVIKLPDKMYLNTWVNPYLVILGRNNKKVKFFDASNYYIASRIGGKRVNILSDEIIKNIVDNYKKGNDVVSINIKTIRENNYSLNPLRYINDNESVSEKVSLGSVLDDVKRGISLSAAEMDELILEEPSDIRCILPSSINDGAITKEYYYHGEIKKQGKNETSHLDVLLSKTGNPFRVALANGYYLVIGNVYILKIDSSKINPYYVKSFLSSEQGQNEIKKYAVGPTTPIISIENLRKIQIPVFEEKKQEEINQRCEEIFNEIEKYNKQIMDCRQEINSIFEGR